MCAWGEPVEAYWFLVTSRLPLPPFSFGHQDAVAALDALSRECCVTAGGRDGTVRVWKIPEESQLVFYGHQ